MKRTSISGGWKVVGGSACGIAFGSVVFFTSSFALFAAALGQQYTWTQIELSTGATIFLTCLLVGWPVSGWVLDRWGTKKVSIASIALFGSGLALLSQIHTLPGFYFLLALLGFAGTGTNVVSYARAITLWFDRNRGLALGVAASAQAFGATLLPLVAQKIIGEKGPSMALLTIAAIEAFLCIPAIAIFVTDSPGSSPQSSDNSKQNRQVSQSPLAGAELAEVLRTSVFWKLCICFGIGGATVFTLSSNIVFILSQTAAMRPAGVAKTRPLQA
jgi:MFS family permease